MKKYTLPKEVSLKSLGDLEEKTHSLAAAQLLAGRGFIKYDDFVNFCNFDKEIEYKDLYDCTAAAKLLEKYIKSGEKICVYGDYDVDGIVAASNVWKFLSRVLSLDATVYVPNRHEEGYGLNSEALQEIYDKGSRLIITVDCGIRDKDLVKEWKKKGLDFIITDHHQPGEQIPDCPIVHPLYPDHNDNNKYTSGGVVAWKFIKFLEERLGKDHSFSDSVIDLVGLTLITDIMPLVGENRIILKKALEKAKVDASLPIKFILLQNNIKMSDVNAYHFGYVIGPRLNATGRVGDVYQSLRLLSTEKEDFAREVITTIEEVNLKRQTMMRQTIFAADDTKKIVKESIIIAYSAEWDDGVIGLVAGRLMNKYDMPTIVMTKEQSTGFMKGSARSISNLNITEVLEGFSNNLQKYGGHHAAAGFTTNSASFDDFLSAFDAYFKDKYSEYKPESQRKIDIVVAPGDVTAELYSVIKKMEPYGPENPAPVILIRGFIDQVYLMGANANHARIILEDQGQRVTCVYFNCESVISKIKQGEMMSFIGKINENEYNGKVTLQFIIDDIFEE